MAKGEIQTPQAIMNLHLPSCKAGREHFFWHPGCREMAPATYRVQARELLGGSSRPSIFVILNSRNALNVRAPRIERCAFLRVKAVTLVDANES